MSTGCNPNRFRAPGSRCTPAPDSLHRLALALCLAWLTGAFISPESAWAGAAVRGLAGRRTPVVRAVERAAPAVVNISTLQVLREVNPFSRFQTPLVEEFFRDFFGRLPKRQRRERSLGSGVVIRPDGYILTNEHVISRASEIRVALSGDRTFPARIVGSDRMTRSGHIVGTLEYMSPEQIQQGEADARSDW